MMNEVKLYAAAAVFVFMTVLKLLLPVQTETLRQQVVALVDMDTDYRSMVTQVGALLMQEPVQQVMGRIGLTFPIDREEEVPTVTLPPTVTAAPLAENVEVSESVIATVEAFHAAQAAYADHETPSNVFYDTYALPFAFTAPVSRVVSSGFGYRVHPLEQCVLFHYGTDYDVDEGTSVAAFADGRVIMSGEEAGYGKYAVVEHAEGWKTLYAHCSSILVNIGDDVVMGQCIAQSGRTGRVTGPHLHFELMRDDQYTNPEFFLS